MFGGVADIAELESLHTNRLWLQLWVLSVRVKNFQGYSFVVLMHVSADASPAHKLQ